MPCTMGLRKRRRLVALVSCCGWHGPAEAALSLKGPTEDHLHRARQRMVVREDDVDLGARPRCDSQLDGPFCGQLGTRVPISTVSEDRLFRESDDTSQHVVSQIASAMSRPLPWETSQSRNFETIVAPSPVDVPSVEGKLQLANIPPHFQQPPEHFSAGLPRDVEAHWPRGFWRVVTVAPDRAAAPEAVALATASSVTSVSFTASVVVQELHVLPPEGSASSSASDLAVDSVLVVTGLRRKREVWKTELDSGAVSRCAVGDQVIAQWPGDRNWYSAQIAADSGDTYTMSYHDGDHRYRQVMPSQVKKDGRFCSGSRLPLRQGQWTDLAQSLKSADEIVFASPDAGWRIGTLRVATVLHSQADKQTPDDGEMVIRVGKSSVTIEAVSPAAVLYSVNDMLSRGLYFKKAPRIDSADIDVAASQDAGQGRRIHRHGYDFRASAALLEMLEELKVDPSLPRGLSLPTVLKEAQNFLASFKFKAHNTRTGMNVADVGQHTHFESYFAWIWDTTPVPNLELAMQAWRRRPPKHGFEKGQKWLGQYYCSQGPTLLELGISAATPTEVKANMKFTVKGKQENNGQFGLRAGRGRGRDIPFEPLPNSWVSRPEGYEAVGLHGVLSKDGMRFSGSVPVQGCDHFSVELTGIGGHKPKPQQSEPARKTRGGCRCKQSWSPDAGTCVTDSSRVFHGCGMAPPCDGDSGGVVGDSWCVLESDEGCSPAGVGSDYCTPPTDELGVDPEVLSSINKLVNKILALRKQWRAEASKGQTEKKKEKTVTEVVAAPVGAAVLQALQQAIAGSGGDLDEAVASLLSDDDLQIMIAQHNMDEDEEEL